MTTVESTDETATKYAVRDGWLWTGQWVQVPYDRSWIILASRRDLAWQRVRLGLAGAAIFAAGVASAGIIWR